MNSEKFMNHRRRLLNFNLIGLMLITCGVLWVNPSSILNFFYYLTLWVLLFLLVDKGRINDYFFAFVFNSILIVFFYLIQTQVYPNTYGTTSPLGSWTDDSYFFVLVADSIPSMLETRENFEEYTHPFATLIRLVSALPISHPMDVIFFQSGVAAFLATSTKRLMLQISENKEMSELVFFLCLACPFLAMHGGVILLRDTFVSALFIYSICCVNDRKFILAIGAVVFSLVIRPGTVFVLMFAYCIIYIHEIKSILSSFLGFVAFCLISVSMAALGVFVLTNGEVSYEYLLSLISAQEVSFMGRELYEDVSKREESIFLSIQDSTFIVKLLFGGMYFFVYPFFSFKELLGYENFDLRTFLISIIMPVYSIWLNTYFISAVFVKDSGVRKLLPYIVAVLVVYMLLGTYSLQTRHKTIVQALFYIVVAIGYFKGSRFSNRVGFAAAISLFSLQFFVAITK